MPKGAETAWWVKSGSVAGSVYPGDHTQGGSPQLQRYKAMYEAFGDDEKPVKHLIEVRHTTSSNKNQITGALRASHHEGTLCAAQCWRLCA